MTDRQSCSAPSARLVPATSDRVPAPAGQRRRPDLRQIQSPRRGGRAGESRVTAACGAEPHIVVVDIEPALRDSLVQCFTSEGMLATAVAASDDLSAHVQRLRPQLVLLGLGAHSGGAIERCARLRAEGQHVPVILVATQHDEVDCVLGLETGADDYVVLPLSARELLARCRAAMRRAQHAVHTHAANLPPVNIGDCVFDPARRRISRGTEERHLTPMEYAILAELLLHPAQPISRQRLLEVSHGTGKAPLARSIDTAVMRLRRLVEPEPAHPLYLQTLHGRGYMFLPTGRRGG